MEKEAVDTIITEYLQKIYGFAYKKSFSYYEAEDLASEMVVEVYRSLLAQNRIVNIEGYIWRICEHTYAKYVSINKKHKGISIDEITNIPYYDNSFEDSVFEEEDRLRREIAFLSSQRRDIIFRFYYKHESIRSIASRLHYPEGTVKWHLNKARNELKEGLTMERKISELGLNPVTACQFGHSGYVGANGGPEYYLGDKLSLNIVYSVYFSPKNVAEIAEELGVTPVFIEDKVATLESNGYLIKTKGGKYTTYVRFSLRNYSREQWDNELKRKLDAARILVKEYVPLVRNAIADAECYIPGGNRQLLEASAVFYAVSNCCSLKDSVSYKDIEKYNISDLCGGKYIAHIELEKECSDPDYEMKNNGDYDFCGDMWRSSVKYPSVQAWSTDTRFDTRTGAWKNNLTSDYEYLYEYINGKLDDTVVNADKIARLKDRNFIDNNGNVQIMICKENSNDFFKRIPELDEKVKEKFADLALENAMQKAKCFPPQMQDLIIYQNSGFFNGVTALMVLELLYNDGTFDKLSENEKTTVNLIMFSDVLPKKK